MITAAILNLLSAFFGYVLGFFPQVHSIPDWFTAFLGVLKVGLYFFPADVLVIIIANVMTCNLSLIAWSALEWAYKKIPGVD